MHDSFYRAFEDRHRGSKELIRSRLMVYEQLLEGAGACLAPLAALDLGCGRGEWLGILAEHDWAAHGVDLDEGMLAACREAGLSVARSDALTTLRAQPDNSLALVSAFHLVEHIPFDDVRQLIAEALRALQPGGILILETPNPENLSVGACSFYLDPSHARPLPPPLLAFAVEHAGFARQTVYRLQEPAELHGSAPVDLLAVLTNVSPDYALVAQKGAADATFAHFNEAFRLGRGLSLAELALRHDAGLDKRLDDLTHRLEAAQLHLDKRLDDLTHRLGAAQLQLDKLQGAEDSLEAKVESSAHTLAALEAATTAMNADVESHLAAVEARTAQVAAVYASRSWRFTAPLRAATGWIKGTALGRLLKRLLRRS
jgi:SAM-dependent methyltransferase